MPRAREFDTDAALEAALGVFWERGYEATSLPDLLAAMGIQRGSFYAAFGSKREVFVEGMERYLEKQRRRFEAQMEGLPPLEALRSHARGMVQSAIGEEASLGCHVMNTAMEGGGRDAEIAALCRSAMEKHRAMYETLLQAAVDDGSLPPGTDVRGRATALLGLLFGLRTFARAGLPRAWAHDVGRQFEALLEAA